MIENIVRHIEEGLSADARRRSRAPARSASPSCRSAFSLIAVFIPLLLMSGIVGRLFREFAVTVSVAIARFAGGLADADADDVLALPASSESTGGTAGSTASSSACFDGLLDVYRSRPQSRAAPPASSR